MKRINLGLFTLIIVSLTLGGCTKEKYVSFHARFQKYTPQDGSKVYLNESSSTPTWNNGDVVKVNREDATVSISDGSSEITGVTENNSGYGIFYPAAWVSGSLTVSGGTIAIPSNQKYEEANGNQVLLSPMATQAQVAGNVKMKNVCGIIRVQVSNSTGSSLRVSKIVLEADHIFLWGNFSLALGETTATLTYSSGGGKTLTLDCSDAPAISNGSSKNFYIAVPAYSTSDNNKFRVKVFANNNGYEYIPFNKRQNGNGSDYYLNANEIGTVPAGISALGTKTGAMVGVFTVSSSKKVQFSHGNVNYSSGQWSFANNQYDFVGGQTQSYNADPKDLFGWATGVNPNTVPYNDIGNNIDGTDYDWSKQISEVYRDHSWSLLTSDEWSYLLNTRGVDNRFALAVVNGKTGLIIFPDHFSTPSGITLRDVNTTTCQSNSWPNSFNLTQWEKIENAGAIFLPQAGYTNTATGTRTSYIGYYWTGRLSEDGKCWIMRVSHTAGVSARVQILKSIGCSVRPVTEVQ